MRDTEFVQKAEQVVMKYGPLPSRQIAKMAGYERQRPGRALGRSRNLYHIGDKHDGIWYLEHQLLEARNQHYDICEGLEKRKEARRNEGILYLPVNPNIHSLLSLFKTKEDTCTAEKAWKVAGGGFIQLRRHLGKLEKDGILFAEGRPKIFRRNPDSALDGMFGDAAEEIFKDYFK